MGIDAMALLRIPNLKPPKSELGTTYLVYHRGDCSMLYTMNRFHGTAPDEHALALRQILGDALDAHDDPRGIYFFPDVCEPRSQSYGAILDELGDVGVWAPKVADGHVPARITEAAPGTFEALVRAALVRGGEEGRGAVEVAEILHMVQKASGAERPESVAEYRAHMAKIAESMGAAFVTELEQVLDARYLAMLAAQEEQMTHMAKLGARMDRGEPLVSSEEMSGFLQREGTGELLESLAPGLKEQLAKAMIEMNVDLDALPDDDLGKQLARTMGIGFAQAPTKPKKKATTKRRAATKKKAATKKRA